jgi:hypothetical protein
MLTFGYDTQFVTGLPSGENTRSGWAVSNLLHTQVNLTPRNILFTDFLVNVDNEGRVGLGPLDPVSTTQKVHTREYFVSMRDQVYFGGRSLVEFGYGHNQFSLANTPQGQDLYVFSPEGRSGNYFVTSEQTASRDQAIVHGYAPVLEWAGSHQLEAGVDADFVRYDGHFQRTGYELIGLSGLPLSRTSFAGPGIFGVTDTRIAIWALDTWRMSKRLQVEAGLREEGSVGS